MTEECGREPDGSRLLLSLAHQIFAHLVLYFDAIGLGPDGKLTANRLTSTAVTVGICSRGGARAIISQMRWAGYLVPGETALNRRDKPLVATPRFLDLFRDRWRSLFAELAAIDAAAARAGQALADPAAFGRLCSTCGEGYLSGFDTIDAAPELRPVAGRTGGVLVLFALFALTSADEHPNVTRLAKCCCISRAQAHEILVDAAGRGLTRSGPRRGSWRLTDLGADRLAEHYAETACFHRAAAAAAGL